MDVRQYLQTAACALFGGVLLACPLQPFQSTGAEELVPGVLVSAEDGAIYLMSPRKKVVAIKIDDGSELWQSEAASKPLSASAGALVCQAETADVANRLELVTLDLSDAGKRLNASAVELPAEVVTRIDDGLENHFRARATAIRDEAFVSWLHESVPIQGIRPGGLPPGQGAPVVRNAQAKPTTGTIRINVQTGAVAALDEDSVPPAVMSAQRSALTDPSGTGTDPFQRVSSDGRHLLKSRRVGDASVWNRYEWSVVEIASGEEVGKLRSHLSQSDFLVTGTTILFVTGPYLRREGDQMDEQPRALRAHDLSSNRELWSEPLRDTAYRGSYPP